MLFMPVPEILHEILSPVGIAHFYRQLYFNLDEGVGPIEEAFTIAPLETLEVVYETVRRQVQEEVMETGVQETSESELESHNLEEVSDKVSSMLQRDLAAGIQTRAAYSTPVFQVGVSASLDLSSSTKRSTEETLRRLKETTKRASERITKTFSLRVRSVDEFSATTTTRRTIENKAEHPVSFGLRRVMRRVRVKVQDLGPRLVWQYYVREPGAGLPSAASSTSRAPRASPCRTYRQGFRRSPRAARTGSAVCAGPVGDDRHHEREQPRARAVRRRDHHAPHPGRQGADRDLRDDRLARGRRRPEPNADRGEPLRRATATRR